MSSLPSPGAHSKRSALRKIAGPSRHGSASSARRRLFFESLEARQVLTAASAVVSAAALSGMNQLYAVNNDQWDFNDPYLINNSGSIAAGSYDRVAYFVELGPVGNTKWVWVSMDAFNTNPLMVGVPIAGSNIVQNGTVVTNMKVESSSGSGVTPISASGNSGIIEFWASNYSQGGGGLFGSNDGFFDWKDSGGSTGGGHGCFQVFAFTSPAQTSANTIFGVTANGGAGIGNQNAIGAGDTDWTFGTNTSAIAIRNLEVWVGKENAPPTIANLGGDLLTYTPGSGAQVIDQGTAAVANDPPPIGSNAWNTGLLTVSIPTGGVAADDVLSVRNQGSGAGQIGFAAGTVSFGGTAIGTVTGGTGGTNLVVTFNAAATTAAVSALLNNITYLNANAATAATTRQVRFVVTDGNGISSTASDAAIAMNVGGPVATYVWDGNSDGDGDGITFTDPLNWATNLAPDSNDIAIFRTADPGPVNVGANTFVGEIRFDGTGSFTLQNGTLNTNRIDQQAAATGTNVISAQISSVIFTGLVSGGQLSLTNTANSATILGGLWTINVGGKVITTTSGANTGIGKANVDANGGTIEFGAGGSTTVNSLIERWYPNVFADTNLIIDAVAANNADAYYNLTADSTSTLSTNLGNFDTNALIARSPSNLAPFGNRFGATWTGQVTIGGASPIPAGDVSFGTSSDDGSAIYVDSNNNGTFESTELVVDNRGGHGNQSRIGTVNLAAGTYGVYIAYYESSGGGNMEARYASGTAIAYASQTIINPTTQAGAWTSQAVAAGNLPNNIRVLANSTLIMGATLPGVKLNQLTMNSGTTLQVQSPDQGQDLEFTNVVLNGNAVIDSTGKPDVTLRNISETAAANLTYSGNQVVFLPTASTYTGLTTISAGVTAAVSANGALGTVAGGTTVQSGGSLRLSGGFAYTTAEPLTLNGTGTAVSDAALNNLSGNNDWGGPITLASAAKIRDANGTMRLLGQIDTGANPLELRADGQMEILLGLSGSGAITKTGTNRTIVQAAANAGTTFTGQLNVNEGIWDARANNALGTTAGATIIANNARLELQGGVTLADNISVTGNGSGNGGIRNENGTNVLSGTVTLTGATEFFLNDTSLTINNGIAGNQVLTKTGVGTLILKQNNTLSNFLLRGGEVRISTVNGLGSTTALTIGGGQALEFDGSLLFNGSTTLAALTVNGGTLSGISGTTTLDIPITVGLLSNINFDGPGNLIIQRAFGNGNAAVSTPNSLNHFGYHINNDATVMNLNGNGGMMNGTPPNPTAFTSFFGTSLLTNGPVNQGLRFTQDADFIATGNIGQVDNYSNLFLGILRVTAANAGVWNLRINQQDDPTGIWLDLNQDGIFQSNGALNSGQNEQLAWNDTGNKTATLAAGDYMVAFTHREGGGGSVIDARFRSPTMGAEAIVNPSDPTQAGIWNSFSFVPKNGVVKSGTGTVTLAGNNTYNGTTTINGGLLVAGNAGAMGLTTAGTVVNSGGTLGFGDAVGVTVSGEAITANGSGAAGQAGAIVNVVGNNTYTGAITAAVASSGTLGIGSTAGTLTLNGTINQQFSQIVFNGSGNVLVNSVISGNGVSSLAAGITETIFNASNVGDPQTNIEVFRSQTLGASDARGVLSGDLNYVDDNAVSTRAAALGAVGFDNGDFAMLWITTFTPNEAGVWQFQFANEDDNAGIWLDTTGAAGVFEIGDRIYNRGCCAGSGVVNTPSLTAGQPYLLGIVMNDTGGGGNFTNMQFKSPTGAGYGGGAFQTINATNFPLAFQNQTIANNAVVKNGAGTVTLAGANTYNGITTINNGALVAANAAALGATTAGTTVVSGGTLGFANNITLTGEPLTINGTGATGQPGALANISGNNTIAASTPINVQVVSLGSVGIGSTAGTLTLAGPLNLKSSKLVVDGAGSTVLSGVVSGTGVDVGGAAPENAGAVTGVFTNVPEAAGYIMAYEVANMPNSVNGALSFPYSRDNTATIQPFDRIAYYMELQAGAGPLTYVYVSMNAFTTNLAQIGVPNGNSGPAATRFKWQQLVSNMNVFSNAPTSGAGAITPGTGIATGNIEIWPSNYGGQNSLPVPNASATAFDFGDGGSDTNDGYGSFQIHNYDIDGAGAGTTGQVLMAYNNWRNGNPDIGISTRTTGEPDYTFAGNFGTYTVKRMAILVRETTPRLIQTNNSLIKNGTGSLTLSAANTYNGVTTVAAGNLIVNGSIVSLPTVQTGGTLSGSGTTPLLTVNAGGTHAPGNPVAIQTVAGNYVENGTLAIQIATPTGTVAGTDFDQVKITSSGSVTLGATSALTVTYTGAPGTFAAPQGTIYKIIDNDGTAAGDTTGTFAGLAEGASLTIDGRPYIIQYHAGDGNDVVLVAQSTVPTTLYINDQFPASGVVDGDLETAGIQTATIGTSAFSTIAAALAAYPGYSDVLVINGGTYAANLTGGGNVTVRLVQDIANSEPNVTFSNLSGDVGDTIVTRFFNAANANLITTTGAFSGVISGTGNVVKTTAGTVTLSGTNTYSGLTDVQAGILTITNATALGTAAGGTTVANGAQLQVSGGIIVTGESVTINGTGGNSQGALNSLSGNNTWAGPIVVGTAGTNNRVGSTAGNFTLSGAISGGQAGALGGLTVRNGGGVTIVSGNANTYLGDTTVVVGTLRLSGGSDRLPVGTKLAVGNTASVSPAQFDLGGQNQTVAGLYSVDSTMVIDVTNSGAAATLTVNLTSGTDTYNGVITGAVNLTKDGAGVLVLGSAGGNGANTYTGATTVVGGRLHLNKPAGQNAIPGNLDITTGGLVSFGANNQIADTSTVTVSGLNSVFNGTGFNAGQLGSFQETIANLTVNGGTFQTGSSSNWNIAGTGSFTGGPQNAIFLGNSGTSISFGALNLTGMNAMPGSTVQTANSFAIYGGGPAIGTVTVGSGGLTLNGSVLNLRRSATAGQPGSRLVLNGNVVATGASASSILLDPGSGTNGASNVELSGTAGATNRTFDVNAGSTLAVSVPITDGAATPGSITKIGAGTVLLSGVNLYTGTTSVNGGTAQLQGGAAIADSAGPVNVGLGGTLQLLTSETVSSYAGAGDIGAGTNDSTLALGGNILTTTGSAALGNVTFTAGGSIVAGTAITDADDDNNITGPGLVLQATAGIGTAADPLETTVPNLEASGGSGGVFIANTGDLIIGGVSAMVGVSAIGAGISVSSTGSLTVNENVTASGAGANATLSTVDSAAAGQNLTIGAATVSSAAGSVVLSAGDDFSTVAASIISSPSPLMINIDSGNADPVGGTLTIAAGTQLLTPSAVFNSANPGAATDVDTFTFAPLATVPIVVNAFNPISGAGDVLNLNLTGVTGTTLTIDGVNDGTYTFTNRASVEYNSIEVVNAVGAAYDLVLNMAGFGIPGDFTVRRSAPAVGGNLEVVNNSNGTIPFSGNIALIASLSVLGTTGNDRLVIDDVNGMVSFDSALTPSAVFPDNPNGTGAPRLYFSAGAGVDTLNFNLTEAGASQVYSIGASTGPGTGEGEIATTNTAGRNLVTYFSGLGTDGSAVTRTGAAPAGSLLVAGDTAANTINVQANGTSTRVDPVGYTPLDFTGNNYGVVTVDGGIGADVLTLVSLGSGQSNPLPTNLNGGVDADTLRVQSTSGNTGVVTLTGNSGSDLFQLFSATNTVDGIVGPVIVDGSDGNVGGNTDTLTIIDSGDLTGDTVLVNPVNPALSADFRVEGITSTPGDDVTFRNIDVLNYTGTQGTDTIDSRFLSTVPQHDLSVVTLNGWTGADQFLLFTADQAGGSGPGVTPNGVASGVAQINLNGDAPGNPNGVDGNDIFGQTPPGLTGTGAGDAGLAVPDTVRSIRPSVTTAIAINGGQPTGPALPTGDTVGDVLNLDISALPPSSALVLPTVSGVVATTGLEALTFAQIEDLNLVLNQRLVNVQMGDTLVVGSSDADLIQFMRNPTSGGPNGTRVRVNTLVVDFVATGKTLTFGGAADDYVTQGNVTLPTEIYGGDGDDYISGGIANDFLVGGLGSDQINASRGDNVVWGDNVPTIPGDPTPQDSAIGGDDTLSGLDGNDVFYGGGGNDSINAGAGDDYLNGGQGDDTLDGNLGNDRLYGGAGNDVLGGSAGDDLISGGGGSDNLLGGTGNDVLIAGSGADSVDGGSGNDLIVSGSVLNESSTWTSVPSVGNYSPTTYSNPADNDAALVVLLAQWSATSNRGSLGPISHDGADDDLWGGTGDDDFCWEAADIADELPALTPPDYNAALMGSDERFGPS